MTEREKLDSIVGKYVNDLWTHSDFGEYAFNLYTERFNSSNRGLILYKTKQWWNDPITEYKAVNLEKGINDLNRYFFTFNLGAKIDGVLIDNYYIGIKGMSVEDCLIHLILQYNLSFKTCYVSDVKPAVLKPAKITHNCYVNYINSRVVSKTELLLKKKNIINMEELC